MPAPELKALVPQAASRADFGYVNFDGTVPFMNASEWRKLQIVNRNDPAYRPPQ